MGGGEGGWWRGRGAGGGEGGWHGAVRKWGEDERTQTRTRKLYSFFTRTVVLVQTKPVRQLVFARLLISKDKITGHHIYLSIYAYIYI